MRGLHALNVGFPGWPGTKEDSDSRYVWAFIQSRDLQPPACMLIIRDHRYGKANEPKRIDPSSSIFSPDHTMPCQVSNTIH